MCSGASCSGAAALGPRAEAAGPPLLPQAPNQPSSSLGLVVLAEDTHKTLLAHKICTDEDIYHRQGEQGAGPRSQRPFRAPLAPPGPHCHSPVPPDDTIITWSDHDIGTDVALSFQEATGCHAIWCAGARARRCTAGAAAAPAAACAPPAAACAAR